jgi:glutamine synthetase
MLRMVDTGVLPAAWTQQEAYARSVAAAAAGGAKVAGQKKALASYAATIEEVLVRRAALEAALAAVHRGAHGDAGKHARGLCDEVRPAMAALRAACDRIEATTDAALWPYPTYHQMLFM